jgi:hypothetical protein
VPALKDKIKLVMDEACMMVLGAQILLGFLARVFLSEDSSSLDIAHNWSCSQDSKCCWSQSR